MTIEAPAPVARALDRPTGDRDLRADLAEAIATLRTLTADADRAKDASDRAEIHLSHAAARVRALENAKEAAHRSAIEEHGKHLAGLLRCNGPLPPPPAPLLFDDSVLADALTAYRSLETAAAVLSGERDAAAKESALAAGRVEHILGQILDAEAAAVAAELIAATELTWRLSDKLAGMLTLDRERPHARLDALQREVRTAIDRRRREVARDATLVEQPRWNELMDRIEADQAAKWRAYAARLSTDPSAQFDDAEPMQQ